ncbi:hypothetical protein [Novosphingobium profundi]|uniref:hypothetical protein n=1 Tax=Novosphingobium profundi TaxID=1774954 RepID=UPI0031BB1FC4
MLLFLAVALALRANTFASPNLSVDEAFYQTVGVAMHKGYLPYVDIWDRKPWGLFFLFYLIAFLSSSPLAYKLVACLFSAATAWCIARFATLGRPNARAGLPCGLVYLLWLDPLQGFGGQSPVFYNLFIATAALLVYRARGQLLAGEAPKRVALAMLLAGCAITIKTTALFEAVFLGLAAAFWQLKAQAGPALPRRFATIAAWALIGALPALAIAAWYALHGYWDIYWHAMVTSNLDKPGNVRDGAIRATIDFILLAPVLIVGVLALPEWKGAPFAFLRAWLLAALVGLCSVPRFYMHYCLPILVPLSILPARFLERRILGPLAVAALAIWSVPQSQAFDFARSQKARAGMEALLTAIRQNDDGRDIYVVDAPPALYMMSGHRIPSPLIFPGHLAHTIERDVSHLSTIGEVRRVLATHPGIIVVPPKVNDGPENREVMGTVRAYAHAHCRKVASVRVTEIMTENLDEVWAHCTP